MGTALAWARVTRPYVTAYANRILSDAARGSTVFSPFDLNASIIASKHSRSADR